MSKTEEVNLEKPVVPNLLSTIERWNARMRMVYEGSKIGKLYGEVRPTPEDFERFKQANPEEGAILDRFKQQKDIMIYGTAIGTPLSIIQATRWTRVKPYLVITAFVGGFASFLTSSHIGSWITGIYKYDSVTLNRHVLEWVRDSRSQQQQQQQQQS